MPVDRSIQTQGGIHMSVRGYRVVERLRVAPTKANGLHLIRSIAWLRLGGLGLSLVTWGLIIVAVHGLIG